MPGEEGIPQLPRVWFWSGDQCFLLREVPTTKKGTPYSRMYLVLTEAVAQRYGIEESKLDWKLSDYGAYVKEYPTANVVHLTGNPESPVTLITCNFDGTETHGEKILEISNKLKRYDKTIANLKDENRRLLEELKVANQRLGLLSQK